MPGKTRKKFTPKKRGIGIKQLRNSFDHMEKVVSSLKETATHSFDKAINLFKHEWEKTFKHSISPADAANYLKFRFRLMGKKSLTRRKLKQRGGAMAPLSGATAPLAGAPLDYSTRSGDVYSNFPAYNTSGLDRSYGSALQSTCGVTQKGGNFSAGSLSGINFAGLRMTDSSNPVSSIHSLEMSQQGQPAYPSSDPTGVGPLRSYPSVGLSNAGSSVWARSSTTMGSDAIFN
jgi:hypothetical protein